MSYNQITQEEWLETVKALKPIDVHHLYMLTEMIDCEACIDFLSATAEWLESHQEVTHPDAIGGR